MKKLPKMYIHPILTYLEITDKPGAIRLGRCLAIEKITDINQILQMTVPDLLKVPNLGKKSVALLHEAMTKKGLPFAKTNREKVVDDVPEGHINNLNLSIRVGNILWREGLVWIDDINKLSDKELLRLDGLGIKSLKDIRFEINNYMKQTN